MKSFLQRFGSLVSGVLHGFDRLRLRGSKRQLCNPGGFFSFLSHLQVPLQHYKSYAKDTTLSLCKAIETQAKQVGLYRYLNNSQESKEETALHMAAEQQCQQELIAILGCVEPCQIVQMRGNKETQKLEYVPSQVNACIIITITSIRTTVCDTHGSDLVSVHYACGTQRSGLASPANDQGRLGVPTEG